MEAFSNHCRCMHASSCLARELSSANTRCVYGWLWRWSSTGNANPQNFLLKKKNPSSSSTTHFRTGLLNWGETSLWNSFCCVGRPSAGICMENRLWTPGLYAGPLAIACDSTFYFTPQKRESSWVQRESWARKRLRLPGQNQTIACICTRDDLIGLFWLIHSNIRLFMTDTLQHRVIRWIWFDRWLFL